MKPLKKEVIVDIITTPLVILFAYTALSKLSDYTTFKLQIGKSPFVSDLAENYAWIIPVAEILIVILLIKNSTRILGLYASLFIMTLFTEYIYAMLHFSYYLPCSCGGILSKLNWTQHLWFNIAFTVISLLGILLDKHPTQKSQMPAENYKTILMHP